MTLLRLYLLGVDIERKKKHFEDANSKKLRFRNEEKFALSKMKKSSHFQNKDNFAFSRFKKNRVFKMKKIHVFEIKKNS